MSATETRIWIQLYVGTEKSGNTFGILRKNIHYIDDLTNAVKDKRPNALQAVDAADLTVFPTGTDLDELDTSNPLDPGNTVPVNTSSKNPLIVVAPLQSQSLQFSNSRPPLSPTSQTQTQQQMEALFATLALENSLVHPRKARCRMWKGDRTVYKLKAMNFREFNDAVRAKYSYLDDAQTISYYVIKQKNDVGSRSYISNDDELNDFFDLAGKPTIYIWPRDAEASLSPASLPAEVEIHVSSAESISVPSSSSRGHNQKLFRQSVRKRDDYKCVLSGETLKEKTGNLEAAHIFGSEPSLSEYREAAGVFNAYDTFNGMLLEKSLHLAFDTFQWCMDEDLVVHVSEEGRKDVNIQKWEGKSVRLSLGSPLFPHKEHIRARFALYNEKQKKRKNTRKPVKVPN